MKAIIIMGIFIIYMEHIIIMEIAIIIANSIINMVKKYVLNFKILIIRIYNTDSKNKENKLFIHLIMGIDILINIKVKVLKKKAFLIGF